MRQPPKHWTAREYHDNLLAPLGVVTNQMERTGIPVDMDKLRSIESDMAARAIKLRADLQQWAGRDINWNSWVQLADFLHNSPEEGGLGLEPSPYCKKGEVADDKVATDDRALEWIAGHSDEHRANIQLLRSLRTHERMGRYAKNWVAAALPFGDGSFRLHPTFGLASDHDNRPGARTGRFGVKNPPLNQVPTNTEATGDLGIPKDPAGIRRAFVAPPGRKLVVVDYSQLEIVELAHIIGKLFGMDDPLVRKVAAKEDIHSPLAQYTFGTLANDPEVIAASLASLKDGKLKLDGGDFKKVPRFKLLRNLAKAGIYGNNYGKGEHGFATSVFLPDGTPLGPQRAKLLVQGLRGLYPGIVSYQDFIRAYIEKTGVIVSLFGRWYPLPDARSAQRGLKNRAWRQALNYPMQAGGQEIMALALIAIQQNERLRELGFELMLVVHDEIVGSAPEDTAEECLRIVEQLMCEVVELLVSLQAEGGIGDNWKDTKK